MSVQAVINDSGGVDNIVNNLCGEPAREVRGRLAGRRDAVRKGYGLSLLGLQAPSSGRRPRVSSPCYTLVAETTGSAARRVQGDLAGSVGSKIVLRVLALAAVRVAERKSKPGKFRRDPERPVVAPCRTVVGIIAGHRETMRLAFAVPHWTYSERPDALTAKWTQSWAATQWPSSAAGGHLLLVDDRHSTHPAAVRTWERHGPGAGLQWRGLQPVRHLLIRIPAISSDARRSNVSRET
jgi:hypothetical protein